MHDPDELEKLTDDQLFELLLHQSLDLEPEKLQHPFSDELQDELILKFQVAGACINEMRRRGIEMQRRAELSGINSTK